MMEEQKITELSRIQKEIRQAEKTYNAVKTAITEYQKHHFRPLEKALEEEGSMEGIHNLYGYDVITKARYEKLCQLYEEEQEGVLANFLKGFCYEWERRIENLKEKEKELLGGNQ